MTVVRVREFKGRKHKRVTEKQTRKRHMKEERGDDTETPGRKGRSIWDKNGLGETRQREKREAGTERDEEWKTSCGRKHPKRKAKM